MDALVCLALVTMGASGAVPKVGPVPVRDVAHVIRVAQLAPHGVPEELLIKVMSFSKQPAATCKWPANQVPALELKPTKKELMPTLPIGDVLVSAWRIDSSYTPYELAKAPGGPRYEVSVLCVEPGHAAIAVWFAGGTMDSGQYLLFFVENGDRWDMVRSENWWES